MKNTDKDFGETIDHHYLYGFQSPPTHLWGVEGS